MCNKIFIIGKSMPPEPLIRGLGAEITFKYSDCNVVVFTEGWQTISEYRRIARMAGGDKKIGYFCDFLKEDQPSKMFISTKLTFELINGMYNLGKKF